MKKADIKALERIFEAEINGTLPLQSKAKIYDDLAERGLVFKDKKVLKHSRFPITIRGWYLTHSGRYEYCSNCEATP